MGSSASTTHLHGPKLGPDRPGPPRKRKGWCHGDLVVEVYDDTTQADCPRGLDPTKYLTTRFRRTEGADYLNDREGGWCSDRSFVPLLFFRSTSNPHTSSLSRLRLLRRSLVGNGSVPG